MIYGVSDLQATQQPQAAPGPPGKSATEFRPRWWARPSPWLSGLVALLVIAGITVTQVPRLTASSPARPHSPIRPTRTALPILSGQAFTQPMIAGRGFIGADLRGAQLERLDLRGENFQ